MTAYHEKLDDRHKEVNGYRRRKEKIELGSLSTSSSNNWMSLRTGQGPKKTGNLSREADVKEKGFETYIQGANQQRVSTKRQSEKEVRQVSKDRRKWEEQQLGNRIQKTEDKKMPSKETTASREKPIERSGNQRGRKNEREEQKIDDESIEKYINTMGKEDFEHLRESLHYNANANRMMQYRNRNNRSPSPQVIDDEEIEGIDYKGRRLPNNKSIGGHQQDDDEDDYQDEEDEDYDQNEFDNEIAEEIEDSFDNESELFQKVQPKKNFGNDRIYSGQPEKIMQFDSNNQKKRPISAVTDDRKLVANHSQGSRTQADYYSATEMSHDPSRDRFVGFNEKTKLLNSNPFKQGGNSDVATAVESNKNGKKVTGFSSAPLIFKESLSGRNNDSPAVNRSEAKYSPMKKQDGLEKLFMKISKMNDGERDELEVLIDKIDNGELSVQALKSILCEKNASKSHASSSSALEPVQQRERKPSGILKKSTHANDQLPQSVSLVQNTEMQSEYQQDYELNSEKPETIRFSTMIKPSIAGSIAHGLFENTQALEATLNAPIEPLKRKVIDMNDKKSQQYSDSDEEKDDIDQVYQEEDEEEEENSEEESNHFKNVKEKKALKDTLQLKRDKVGGEFKVQEPTITKKPDHQQQQQQTPNRTYNLSKNRDKSGQQLQSRRELKEQKGEVFINIRVLSTWGSVRIAGLTEIKVYDERGVPVELKAENFMIEGGTQTSMRNIHRICDGVYDTINPDHMWVGTMPDPPKCLEIGILFKSAFGVGALKIWNYNKSLLESIKGIKEVQITRNNKVLYEGIVRQSLGKENENYCNLISFKPGIQIPEDERPQKHASAVRTSLTSRVSDTEGSTSTTVSTNSKQTGVSTPRITKPSIATNIANSNSGGAQQSKKPSNLPVGSTNTNSSTPSSRVRSAIAAKPKDESDVSVSNQALKPRKSVPEVHGADKAVVAVPALAEDSLTYAVASSQATSTRAHRKWGQPDGIAELKAISATVPVSVDSAANSKKNHTREPAQPTSQANPLTSSFSKRGPKVVSNIFDEKPAVTKSQQVTFTASTTSLNPNKLTPSNAPVAAAAAAAEVAASPVDEDREWMMEKVRFFNATHQGRFGAAERERVLQKQADDVKESVEQALKSINPLLLPTGGNGNADKRQGNEIDAKEHFGFEDSDDYNALDMFLDYKQKSSASKIGATGTKPNNSTQTNNATAETQQSKIKSKSILEETIIDDLLREQHQTLMQSSVGGDVFATKKVTPVAAAAAAVATTTAVVRPPSKGKALASVAQDTNQSIDIMDLLRSQKINTLNETDFLNQLKQSDTFSKKSTNNQIAKQTLVVDTDSPLFQIPTLPEGKEIKIEIYSTWGDSHYVGLSGIEFFSNEGKAIRIESPKEQVRATPSDINVLAEYDRDPRTCDKLVDGCYLTCDDLHMWLAPFTAGQKNIVEITLPAKSKISMIRIWNYNKSRIHSYRGAKDVCIYLDNAPIFAGQITRASGNQADAASQCEYIMFTQSESLLDKIEASDWLNTYELPLIEEEQQIMDQLLVTQTLTRPKTGQKPSESGQVREELRESLTGLPRSLIGKDGRPITSAKIPKAQLTPISNDDVERRISDKLNNKSMKATTKKRGVRCKKLRINILQGSEDRYYVGLTGIELYDEDGCKISITAKQLDAEPRDVNAIHGYQGDQRTLEKLIDGVNLTTNEKHMWLAQLMDNRSNYITINLREEKIVSGIKIWNYNKFVQHDNSKGQEAYRGVKMISIVADDSIALTPASGVMLRRALGKDFFDYGQMISLPFDGGWDREVVDSLKLPQQVVSEICQEYDTIYLPRGFAFKFNLHSTWGDAHYIGLNGIEFYDSFGRGIIQQGLGGIVKMGAEPASVNVIKSSSGNDIRTIDKLLNGENNTYDDRNMWLAPYIDQHRTDQNNNSLSLKSELPFRMNTFFVLFQKPVIISAINFWNYSKTPSRGVREVEIFCDDRLIFRGYLKKAPTQEEHNSSQVPLCSTVIFNRNPIILHKIKPVVMYNEDKLHQRVLFFNEGKVDERFGKDNEPYNSKKSAIDPFERPTTKVSSSMRN